MSHSEAVTYRVAALLDFKRAGLAQRSLEEAGHNHVIVGSTCQSKGNNRRYKLHVRYKVHKVLCE